MVDTHRTAKRHAKRRVKPQHPVADAVRSPAPVVEDLGETEAEWGLVRSWVERAFSIADDRSRTAVGRLALALRRLTRVEYAVEFAGEGEYADSLRSAATRTTAIVTAHRAAVALLAETESGTSPVDALTTELVWTAACDVRDGDERRSLVFEVARGFRASHPDSGDHAGVGPPFAGWTASLLRAGVSQLASGSVLGDAEFARRVSAWFTVRLPFLEVRSAFASALSAETEAVPGRDPRPAWCDDLQTLGLEFVGAMLEAVRFLARRGGEQREQGR